MLGLLALPGIGRAAATELKQPVFMAYQEGWLETPTEDPAATTFATIPPYVTLLVIGFVKPDLVYRGDLDIAATGMQHQISGQVMRDAIALAKQRNPDLKVLLAVGGMGYDGWDRLDMPAIGRLVRDLGADGVDLDYEPLEPQCAPAGSGVRCHSDATWRELIRAFRAELPRPYVLTVPGWSVGAYGVGRWKNARPFSPWTGVMVNPLRSPEAAEIDAVSVMAYEAGPQYDPWEAYEAYRAIWKGPLLLGVQVPPSLNGGPVYSVALAQALAARVRQDPQGGIMLYGLLSIPPGPATADNPDGRTLAAALCRAFGLRDCDG